jgi:hypothetical protein
LPALFRVRVEDILLKPNIPAGCNPLVLMSLAHLLRSTDQDPDPVKVRRDGGRWRVSDGRHRFLAAVVAGRPDVLCEEEA